VGGIFAEFDLFVETHQRAGQQGGGCTEQKSLTLAGEYYTSAGLSALERLVLDLHGFQGGL